jgi:hypothetical protein
LENTYERGEPKQLETLKFLAFEGEKMIGAGFIITNEDAKQLIDIYPSNHDVIKKYLVGRDINSNVDHGPSRCAINFFDFPLNEDDAPPLYKGPLAQDYPLVLKIVEEKVKPDRLKYKPTNAWNRTLREKWWQYFWRPEMHKIIDSMPYVLVRSRVSNIHALVFAPTKWLFSDATTVFAYGDMGHFAILQSSLHEVWIQKQASTMRNDLRYTPSSCLQTFVQPDFMICADAGKIYYEYRERILKQFGVGLRTLYNKFNSPNDQDESIIELRRLHLMMDEKVAVAYDWGDINLGHNFHKTKQGIRFTISEDARREVLQRLLKLNHERYEEEVAKGLHDKKEKKTLTPRKKKTSPAKDSNQLDIL